MAMADESLPIETAQARATSGRSEVEKVLALERSAATDQPGVDWLLR